MLVVVVLSGDSSVKASRFFRAFSFLRISLYFSAGCNFYPGDAITGIRSLARLAETFTSASWLPSLTIL